MSEVEAVSRFEKKFNIDEVDAIVKINDGFVFYIFSALQPIYVTPEGMHGLNGNKKEDMIILNKADELLSKGDVL